MAMIENISGHKPRWPLFVIAALAIIYLWLAYVTPPGADTLWRLHIAAGLLDGKTLYRDFVEVNPPLWFWGALPAASLGGYAALVIVNLIASLVAVGLFGALTKILFDLNKSRLAMLALSVPLFLLNVGEIGQREQAFFVACTLWSAIIACRIEGKAMPLWLVISASVFCAYGFALKHYFVAVPIITELVLLAYVKSSWRPLRPETLLLGSLAALYGAAVMTLTPQYLNEILSLVSVSYEVFGVNESVPMREYYTRIFLLAGFALFPALALALTQQKRPLFWVITMCAGAAVVIVILQQRYWRYHMIAANGLALLVLTYTFVDVITREKKRALDHVTSGFVTIGFALLLATGSLVPTLSSLRTQGQYLEPILAKLILQEPPRNHIAILSIAPDYAFYPLARLKRQHWSRHFSMWMMPGLYAPKVDLSAEPLRLAQRDRILQEFTDDLMCTPPNLVIAEVGQFRTKARTRFDPMEFLAERNEFASWTKEFYAQQANVGKFSIWRLKASKPAPKNCVMGR